VVERAKSDISALDLRGQANINLPIELYGVQGVAGSNPAVPTAGLRLGGGLAFPGTAYREGPGLGSVRPDAACAPFQITTAS
jgi:hypothetical protein